jgi:hypothetical protein
METLSSKGATPGSLSSQFKKLNSKPRISSNKVRNPKANNKNDIIFNTVSLFKVTDLIVDRLKL